VRRSMSVHGRRKCAQACRMRRAREVCVAHRQRLKLAQQILLVVLRALQKSGQQGVALLPSGRCCVGAALSCRKRRVLQSLPCGRVSTPRFGALRLGRGEHRRAGHPLLLRRVAACAACAASKAKTVESSASAKRLWEMRGAAARRVPGSAHAHVRGVCEQRAASAHARSVLPADLHAPRMPRAVGAIAVGRCWSSALLPSGGRMRLRAARRGVCCRPAGRRVRRAPRGRHGARPHRNGGRWSRGQYFSRETGRAALRQAGRLAPWLLPGSAGGTTDQTTYVPSVRHATLAAHTRVVVCAGHLLRHAAGGVAARRRLARGRRECAGAARRRAAPRAGRGACAAPLVRRARCWAQRGRRGARGGGCGERECADDTQAARGTVAARRHHCRSRAAGAHPTPAAAPVPRGLLISVAVCTRARLRGALSCVPRAVACARAVVGRLGSGERGGWRAAPAAAEGMQNTTPCRCVTHTPVNPAAAAVHKRPRRVSPP
jgi:hypothetical protein